MKNETYTKIMLALALLWLLVGYTVYDWKAWVRKNPTGTVIQYVFWQSE